MKTALLACALLVPGMAMAGELAYDPKAWPLCPVQAGAVLCDDSADLGDARLTYIDAEDYAATKENALRTGHCQVAKKPLKTLAYYPYRWYGQGNMMRVKTADAPRKWRYVSMNFVYEETSPRVCGLAHVPQVTENQPGAAAAAAH
jgi:hypothetical protein